MSPSQVGVRLVQVSWGFIKEKAIENSRQSQASRFQMEAQARDSSACVASLPVLKQCHLCLSSTFILDQE